LVRLGADVKQMRHLKGPEGAAKVGVSKPHSTSDDLALHRANPTGHSGRAFYPSYPVGYRGRPNPKAYLQRWSCVGGADDDLRLLLDHCEAALG
jgi:hypothetical protein